MAVVEKVELGFDLPSSAGSYFTLDDPVKGKLDNVTYILAGVIFYDVTSRVRNYSIQRGKSRQLDTFRAGVASVTFDNSDRAFDPTYTSSPYYGQIVPKREIRITSNPGSVTGSVVTNLVTNPSLEVSASGWTAVATTTIARSGEASYVGNYSLQIAAPGANYGAYHAVTSISPSTTYTASAWVKAEAGKSFNLRLVERSTVTIGTSTSATTVGTGSWQRVSVTRALGATATNVWVGVYNLDAGSHTYYADAVMLTAGTELSDYFDGTTSSDDEWTAYAWTGTAGLSSSTKTVTAHETGRVFTGLIDDWNLDYAPQGDSVATIVASDGFAKLANQTLTGGTATPQLSGARITAVLDSSDVLWPTDARSIDTGTISLGADVQAVDANVLNYLQTVEITESGHLFIDKSGNLVFRDKDGTTPVGSSAITLADDGTGIKYTGMQVVYGSELLYNQIVTASVSVAGTAIANDLDSQALYGIQTFTRTDLLMANAADVDALAISLTQQYANPEYRFEAVTINLDEITTAEANQVLGMEIGQLCLIKFTPNGIAPAISKYAEVIAIAHNADVRRHSVTLGFSTLDYVPLILDDTVFGKLDTAPLG